MMVVKRYEGKGSLGDDDDGGGGDGGDDDDDNDNEVYGRDGGDGETGGGEGWCIHGGDRMMYLL